jgi:hypothetical protein
MRSIAVLSLGIGFVVGLTAETTKAAVTAVGDVLPSDDPFTLNVFENLPPSGNFIDPTEPPGAQTNFENSDVIPGYENIEAGIVVGQQAWGRLDIDGNSQLRYQTLVIGDQDTGDTERRGTGFVLITGIDALYNNDPTILPAGLPDGVMGADPRDEEAGFDAYVGRFGQGTLEIRGGGRAEIQDAVILGDQPGSTGQLVVDGFASFMGSGGFTSQGSSGEPHQLIVGRNGDGFMTISAGGTVVSDSLQEGAGTFDTFGAVIGGDATVSASDEPLPGGRGTVTVTGLSSKWIVGGSLQIGGFQERGEGTSGENVEGLGLEYNSEAARGTLYVQDNGLVSVRPAIEADQEQDDLRLLIGRFGRVVLNGGDLRVGSPVLAEQELSDTVQTVNDGVIEGSGRIFTGIFRNRHLGEIRVGAGQSLYIDSSSEFRMEDPESEPLVNYGVMRVLGTRDQRAVLEFERAPNEQQGEVRPFFNLRITRPDNALPTDFYGGLISAQHSVLHFRSDIINEGTMAFTAGTNYVTGDVINFDPDPAMLDDEGIIFISGPNTQVVFENDLLSNGTIVVEEGADVDILARHSFVTAGELRFELDPTNASRISTAGDAGITGALSVSLQGFSADTLEEGDTFEIITAAGQLGGVDLTDPLRPRPDLTIPGAFTSVQITPSLTMLGLPQDLVMIPIYTPHSVLLQVLSTAGVMGADFNGDGVVDHADLAILQMNMGLTMGATGLQGDADGDGDVDGQDFLEWQQQLGPVPGFGSAVSSMATSVPEPSSMLLLLAGVLSLASCRRRMIPSHVICK